MSTRTELSIAGGGYTDSGIACGSGRARRTSSGDYRLPGPLSLKLGNAVLWLFRQLPLALTKLLLRSHSYYQDFDGVDSKDSQGSSLRKWEALNLPASLKGKSVLDIGCSEGFFSRQAALSGARPVLGIDSRLSSLLCAQDLARKQGLRVRHRMAVFSDTERHGRFDVVLCLSVLHHMTSTKNIWKVLADRERDQDRRVLRSYLRCLAEQTLPGGVCVVEMPYEYDDVREREVVDFERFSEEMRNAGFKEAHCRGEWEHNKERAERKDRIIYVGSV